MLQICFTSPPKEGMLRIFFVWKIWRLRPGLNPRSWVPEASKLTTRPPKPLTLYNNVMVLCSFNHRIMNNKHHCYCQNTFSASSKQKKHRWWQRIILLLLYSHVLQQIHEKISGNFADTTSHQLVKNEWLDKNNLFRGLKHLSSD